MLIIKKTLILFSLCLIFSFVYGFDKLTEYKLDLQEKYLLDKSCKFLHYDNLFKIDEKNVNSFISYGNNMKGSKDFIFVVDNKADNIKVFNYQGKYIKTIGKRGRGPGDISSPGAIDINKNNLYISNNNGIEVFDFNGNFRNRIKLFFSLRTMFVDNWKGNIYISSSSNYQRKPFIALKMDRLGNVLNIIRGKSKELNSNIYMYSSNSYIAKLADSKFIFVMRHWNKIFFYNEKDNLLEEKEIPYKLGNEIENWNTKNYKANIKRTWFANYIADAVVLDNKIFVLLNMPRLEILVLDINGDIVEHYYNNKELNLMRWYSMIARKEKGKYSFYLLACSIDDNKDDYFLQHNIHKVVLKD